MAEATFDQHKTSVVASVVEKVTHQTTNFDIKAMKN